MAQVQTWRHGDRSLRVGALPSFTFRTAYTSSRSHLKLISNWALSRDACIDFIGGKGRQLPAGTLKVYYLSREAGQPRHNWPSSGKTSHTTDMPSARSQWTDHQDERNSGAEFHERIRAARPNSGAMIYKQCDVWAQLQKLNGQTWSWNLCSREARHSASTSKESLHLCAPPRWGAACLHMTAFEPKWPSEESPNVMQRVGRDARWVILWVKVKKYKSYCVIQANLRKLLSLVQLELKHRIRTRYTSMQPRQLASTSSLKRLGIQLHRLVGAAFWSL